MLASWNAMLNILDIQMSHSVSDFTKPYIYGINQFVYNSKNAHSLAPSYCTTIGTTNCWSKPRTASDTRYSSMDASPACSGAVNESLNSHRRR